MQRSQGALPPSVLRSEPGRFDQQGPNLQSSSAHLSGRALEARRDRGGDRAATETESRRLRERKNEGEKERVRGEVSACACVCVCVFVEEHTTVCLSMSTLTKMTDLPA